MGWVSLPKGERYEREPRWVRPVWWVTMAAMAFVVGGLWVVGSSGASALLKFATYIACALTIFGGVVLGLRYVGEFMRSVQRGKS